MSTAAQKKSIRPIILLWIFSLTVYLVALVLYLTAVAPYTLELMRAIGIWEGLGLTAAVYFLLLTTVPAVLTWKIEKARFGKLCLGWSLVVLLLAFGAAPTGGLFQERGSYVPALVLGPQSAVVRKVAVEKLGWGEGWKERTSRFSGP